MALQYEIDISFERECQSYTAIIYLPIYSGFTIFFHTLTIYKVIQ